jgi:hypothetical protein
MRYKVFEAPQQTFHWGFWQAVDGRRNLRVPGKERREWEDWGVGR